MLAGNRGAGVAPKKRKAKGKVLKGSGHATAKSGVKTTTNAGPGSAPPKRSPQNRSEPASRAPQRAVARPTRDTRPTSGGGNRDSGVKDQRPATRVGALVNAQRLVAASVESAAAPSRERRQRARAELTRQATKVDELPTGVTRRKENGHDVVYASGAEQAAHDLRRKEAKARRVQLDAQVAAANQKATPKEAPSAAQAKVILQRQAKLKREVLQRENAKQVKADRADIKEHGAATRTRRTPSANPRDQLTEDATNKKRAKVRLKLTPRTRRTLDDLERFGGPDGKARAKEVVDRASETGERSISKQHADQVQRSTKDAKAEAKLRHDREHGSWLDNAKRDVVDAGTNIIPALQETAGAVAEGVGNQLGNYSDTLHGRHVKKRAQPKQDAIIKGFLENDPIAVTLQHGPEAGYRAAKAHPLALASDVVPVAKVAKGGTRVVRAKGSRETMARHNAHTRARPTQRVDEQNVRPVVKGKAAREQLRKDIADTRKGIVVKARATGHTRQYSDRVTVRAAQKTKDIVQASRGKDPVQVTGKKATKLEYRQEVSRQARQRKTQIDRENNVASGKEVDKVQGARESQRPDVLRRKRGALEATEASAPAHVNRMAGEMYAHLDKNAESYVSRGKALLKQIEDPRLLLRRQREAKAAELRAGGETNAKRIARESERFAQDQLQQAKDNYEAIRAAHQGKLDYEAHRERLDGLLARQKEALARVDSDEPATRAAAQKELRVLQKAVDLEHDVVKQPQIADYVRAQQIASRRAKYGDVLDKEQVDLGALDPVRGHRRRQQQWATAHDLAERDRNGDWVNPRTKEPITEEQWADMPAARGYMNYGRNASSNERVVGREPLGKGFTGIGVHSANWHERTLADMQSGRVAKLGQDDMAKEILRKAYGGKNGRVGADEADVLVRQLNADSREEWVAVKAGHVEKGEVKRVKGDEEYDFKDPLPGEDGYIVVPKALGKIWEDQMKPVGRMAAGTQMVTKGFLRGVLGLNPGWQFSNVADAGVRLGVAGVRPSDFALMRDLKAEAGLLHTDPRTGRALKPRDADKVDVSDEWRAGDVAQRRRVAEERAAAARAELEAESNPRIRALLETKVANAEAQVGRIGRGSMGMDDGDPGPMEPTAAELEGGSEHDAPVAVAERVPYPKGPAEDAPYLKPEHAKAREVFEGLLGHAGSKRARAGYTIKDVVNSGRLKNGQTRGGKRTELGEKLHEMAKPVTGSTAKRLYDDLVDASFNGAAKIEDKFVDGAQGVAARRLAKELQIKVQDHRALAARILEDPAAADRFHQMTLSIIGDYIRESPRQRRWRSGAMPFLPWLKAASAWTFKTLPADHPLKLAMYAQMAVATEQQRRLLGQSDYITDAEAKALNLPELVNGYLGGAASTIAGYAVPLNHLFSPSQAVSLALDPIDAWGRHVFPQVNGIIGKALGHAGSEVGYELNKGLDALAGMVGIESHHAHRTPRDPLGAGARATLTYVPGLARVSGPLGLSKPLQGGLGPNQTDAYDQGDDGRPKNFILDHIGLGAQSIQNEAPKQGVNGLQQIETAPKDGAKYVIDPETGEVQKTGGNVVVDKLRGGFKSGTVDLGDEIRESGLSPQERARRNVSRVAKEWDDPIGTLHSIRGTGFYEDPKHPGDLSYAKDGAPGGGGHRKAPKPKPGDLAQNQYRFADKALASLVEGKTLVAPTGGGDPEPKEIRERPVTAQKVFKVGGKDIRLKDASFADLKKIGAQLRRAAGAGSLSDREREQLVADIRHVRFQMRNVNTPHLDKLKAKREPNGVVRLPASVGQDHEEVIGKALDEVMYLNKTFGVKVSDALDRDHSSVPPHQSAGHNNPALADSVDFVGTPDATNGVAKWAVKNGYTVYYDGSLGTTRASGHGPGNHIHIEFGSGPHSVRDPKAKQPREVGRTSSGGALPTDGSLNTATPDGPVKATPYGRRQTKKASAIVTHGGGSDHWRVQARKEAISHGIDPDVFERMIHQESNFTNPGDNSSGAAGMAQFIRSTAAAYGLKNRQDPKAALNASARMISSLLKQYGGSYEKALSAYNSGGPDHWKDASYAKGQTYHYVRRILGLDGENVAGGGAAPVISGGGSTPMGFGPPAAPGGSSSGGGTSRSAPAGTSDTSAGPASDTPLLTAPEDIANRQEVLTQMLAMLQGGTVGADGELVLPSKKGSRAKGRRAPAPGLSRASVKAKARIKG
jgi:hypothetical protein